MKYYVHHTPGRLRVKIPQLKGHPEAGERVATLLESLEGVKKISVNSITGSVLATYHPYRITHQQLLDTLEEHNLFVASRAIDSDQYIVEGAFKAGGRIGRMALSWTMGLALEGTPLSLLSAVI